MQIKTNPRAHNKPQPATISFWLLQDAPTRKHLVFAKIMGVRRKPGNLDGWLEYDAENRLDQLGRANQIRKEIYMGR